MAQALVALGANLGERRETLAAAVDRLRTLAEPGTLRVSSGFETPPIGGPSGQEPFLNAAAVFETRRSPEEILAALLNLELELGRIRVERWGARAIDLDLLLYDQRILAETTLELPHPRMAFRRFVLEPAAEVAAEMVHPIVGWSIGKLLDHLNGAAPYVAVLGPSAQESEAVAARVAEAIGGVFLPSPGELPRPDRPDLSGRAADASIQFLDRAAHLLATCQGQAGQWMVSGFSTDRVLADARAALGPAEFSRLAEREVEWREFMVPPKLVVVLEDWAGVVAAHAQLAAGGDPDWLTTVAGGGQPFVCVGRSDPDRQLSEIKAACAAMR